MIGNKHLIGEAGSKPRAMVWKRLLDDAATELLSGDGGERERVEKAAVFFRVALTAYQSWSDDRQARADSIRAKLVTEGRFEATVAKMSEERLRDVSAELRRFCWSALSEDGGKLTNESEGNLDGIDKLRKAKEIVGDSLDRARLRAAARLFWAAEFHCDTWPPGLQATAEALTAKIFRHGPIDDAVLRMSDEAAAEVKQELLRLCDEAEGYVSNR